jgi:hypothetical protein
MTRVKTDPTKKLPKEEIDDQVSIFVDSAKIEVISKEIVGRDPALTQDASQHTLRAVIHLAALGLSNRAIAKALKIPNTRIELMMGSISMKREVEILQRDYFDREADIMFKRLVPAAVQTIFDLMTAKKGKESVRLSAAQYITDRALGKPKEIIEQKTDLLKDVFSQLQNRPKAANESPIDVQFESVGPENEKVDPLDAMLKS